MERKLYLECCSGISGDMFVAALLDLGADEQVLKDAIASLPVDGFQIEVRRVKKSGLDACGFYVVLDEAHENHDYDMEYLHGQKSHHQRHGHHQHEHRGLPEINQIIAHSALTDTAKELAEKIFLILAQAEAKVHGVAEEQVHFHEVGAVDSIVDIVSAAVCMDNLNLTDVIVSELYEGRGTIRCQHGILPIPVPAVANIVKEYGIRLHMTDVQGELVTPTGAAIAAAIRTEEKIPESFYIEKTGLGAGKREYGTAGVLRAFLIREDSRDCKSAKS